MSGCVGGSGIKTESRGLNRAVQSVRQTGSAGKPISVIAPAINKKIIMTTSKIVDEQITFDDGSEEGYTPSDYNKYRGEITIRQAVESSQNVPFVKIMEMLTPKESIRYMKKMGITTLTDVDENLNLALGGLDKGISPLEMAAAYNTIANGGVYIEPTFYKKVEDSNKNVVLKPSQKRRRVYSKEVSYIVTTLLKEPVYGKYGTATYCKIKGIDVAAKTGTTNEEYDRWLCGYTPYYTAVTWFGYDQNETIRFNGKNPSGQIWSSVMSSIHSKLENKSFEKPRGVVEKQICRETGLLARTGCKDLYTDYYLKSNVPTVYCSKHSGNELEGTANKDSSSTSLLENIVDNVKESIESETQNYIYKESTDETFEQ